MAPASNRRSTRIVTKNGVDTPPVVTAGSAQPPKRARRTKAQMEAAREAEKIANKKKEAERETRLTNLAQAADDIVIEMQTQQSSEPRARSGSSGLTSTANLKPPGPPKPLKRTYAMYNVLEGETEASDKDNSVAMPSDADDYVPSGSDVESMDPRSGSAASDAEPPKKKRGKSKKASVLSEIQAKRKHLYPIPEETEVEVQDKEVLMDMRKHSSSHVRSNTAAESPAVLPFKVGLKNAWRAGSVLSDSEPSGPAAFAPKTSKNSAGTRTQQNPGSGPAPAQTKHVSKTLQPSQESTIVPEVAKVQSKSMMKKDGETGNHRAEIQSQVCQRPRPRPVKAAQPLEVEPEVPAPASRDPITYKVVSPQASPVKYGGIPEGETDTEEQAAARSSPVKAGRRITSNTIVSINPTGQAGMTSKRKSALPIAQSIRKLKIEPEIIDINDKSEPEQEIEDRASVAPSEVGVHTQLPLRGTGSRSLSATYDDLPDGVSRGDFKGIFMSTIAKYVVKLADQDPWNTTTKDYANVIQHVWNAVFLQVPYKFTLYGVRCRVFRLIIQRTYEWRAKFAYAAIEAVLDLEASDVDYQHEDFRAEWVAWATEDGVWPFIYADVEAENPEEWTGTFASKLITATLSAHLSYTTNAVVVKGLKNLEAKWPVGALTLAITAVERALSSWDSGLLNDWRQLREKDRPSLPKFDAITWGEKARSWSTSISTLDSESWEDIIKAAQDHVKPSSRKPVSTHKDIESIDARASLVARPRRK